MSKYDDVSRPYHYNTHPSGVECIQITEHHDYCVGNVIKYCWRAGLKVSKGETTDERRARAEAELKDLQKARWYLTRKIGTLEAQLGAAGEADPPSACHVCKGEGCAECESERCVLASPEPGLNAAIKEAAETADAR